MPVGTKSDLGEHREMSLLMNGMVQGVSIEFWNLNGTNIGRDITYRKDKTKNTLRFPVTGYAVDEHSTGFGEIGSYWSATTRFEDQHQGATYYVFHESLDFVDGLMEPTVRSAMRPVTE